MTPNQTWLFYSQAVWKTDQAAYIARTLIDNPPDPSCYATKVTWFAAYNFSIVSYCSPFMRFENTDKKMERGLSNEVVPNEFQELHSQIFHYRHKILAHTDISHMRLCGSDKTFPLVSIETFSAPPIAQAFALFSKVSEILVQKLSDIENYTKILQPKTGKTPI
ncbi:hypothetical protein ACFSSA_12915 [Luteolibacter algae]|uniref:HEPN AbiU2-like domain-containing protein n=2 Tax=Luteolibacter algae TaxID=454151 RepID=A0ABW5D9H1_9BACT